MNLPSPQPDWPTSWIQSHHYDRLEHGLSSAVPGYSCAYALRRHHTLELITRTAPTGARVLDIAAAQGNFSLALAERGYDVTWNDLRAELAGYVRQKHTHGRIAYAPGDVFTLGFDAEFDVVLAGEVVEHVAHPDQFVARLARFLRPGGHLILTTPNGGYFLNRLPRFSDCADPSAFEAVQFKPNADGHIFLLHEDELHRLATSAGLQPRELRLFGTPLANGHVKTAPLLRWLPGRAVEWLDRVVAAGPRLVSLRLCSSFAFCCRRPTTSTSA